MAALRHTISFRIAKPHLQNLAPATVAEFITVGRQVQGIDVPQHGFLVAILGDSGSAWCGSELCEVRAGIAANLFSREFRRNPYPPYEQMRKSSPVLAMPEAKLWLIFDYEGVKRVLEDQKAFSSQHGPVEWMIFLDPPQHTRLRALVSQAFSPRTVANFEPRIREISRELMEKTKMREMDVVLDFAGPLPTTVIAEMLGVPTSDRPPGQGLHVLGPASLPMRLEFTPS